MKLQWFGQSFFLITTNQGLRIVTDPFHDIGYHLPDISADIVTVSHHHNDHNNTGLIKGNPRILSQTGYYHSSQIVIKGISSSHGRLLGSNIIFTYSFNGIRICHLGDLRTVLNRSQLREIGQVDILLIPVGGLLVLNPSKACRVIRQLSPKLVIPMHYRTPAMKKRFYILKTSTPFMKKSGGKHLNQNILDIDTALKQYSGIVSLNYEK